MTTYQYDQKPLTKLTDASAPVLEHIRNSDYSVLVGRNNCGKSFLLKTLTTQWGENASYLGPARYQNFNLLGYYTPSRNRKNEKWNQFVGHFSQQHQNIDNSPINLQQAIAELSNSQRATLTEIVKILLGVELQIRDTVADNAMSQKYISCGGHNVSFTSSGFRLIMTLVTCLLDSEYDTFLIDEPELGISPEAQGILADFLFDREHRLKYFAHIKTLVLATHSTIFLDRKQISNNIVVEKNADEISLNRIGTQTEFNRVHFFLLGNRFETLYLPAAILIVEGTCDHKFIERMMTLHLPNSQISIISANSDSRIKEILNVARGLFTDIQKSPYRDRIFAVLDSTHSASLPAELERMGLPKEHIIVWPKNGIEFYYPPALMDKIYGIGGTLSIEADFVIRNGIRYGKNELAEKIVTELRADTIVEPDFERLLLTPVRVLVAAP
jgi:hypothetical protein